MHAAFIRGGRQQFRWSGPADSQGADGYGEQQQEAAAEKLDQRPRIA
jgi:hypothetical protein